MPKIRILVADDHTLFRQGLRSLLEMEADLEVAGECANATEAVEQAAELRPDIVLLDIGMPGLSSFEAVRHMRRSHHDVKIIFLTMYDDADYLMRSMEAGAQGYILKDTGVNHLATAIRDVHRGGSSLSPKMLSHLVDDFRSRVKTSAIVPRFQTLTAREKEVLKLLAEGNSVKEIAGNLNLSVKTVEAHKFNLMRKLDIHNKAQLVQYAIQKKIVHLPMMAVQAPEAGERPTPQPEESGGSAFPAVAPRYNRRAAI